jgi:hypothetical protein
MLLTSEVVIGDLPSVALQPRGVHTGARCQLAILKCG